MYGGAEDEDRPGDLHGLSAGLKRSNGDRPDEGHSAQQGEERPPEMDARLADRCSQFLPDEWPEEQQAIAA